MTTPAKRKKATDYILENFAGIIPGDDRNVKLTRERLESLTQDQFTELMRSMLPGAKNQIILPFYSPNLDPEKTQLEDLLALAKKIGHDFYEQIWVTDPNTGLVSLTPHKFPVTDMPCRRQAQMRYKKDSIPAHIRIIDDLSGQPTGDSKGAKISYPELQAQSANNLTSTIIEEIKVRGGDRKAFEEFERQILETGTASLERILAMNTKVRSTEITAVLLNSAHLGNNFNG